jgi:hypothetical protein
MVFEKDCTTKGCDEGAKSPDDAAITAGGPGAAAAPLDGTGTTDVGVGADVVVVFVVKGGTDFGVSTILAKRLGRFRFKVVGTKAIEVPAFPTACKIWDVEAGFGFRAAGGRNMEVVGPAVLGFWDDAVAVVLVLVVRGFLATSSPPFLVENDDDVVAEASPSFLTAGKSPNSPPYILSSAMRFVAVHSITVAYLLPRVLCCRVLWCLSVVAFVLCHFARNSLCRDTVLPLSTGTYHLQSKSSICFMLLLGVLLDDGLADRLAVGK